MNTLSTLEAARNATRLNAQAAQAAKEAAYAVRTAHIKSMRDGTATDPDAIADALRAHQDAVAAYRAALEQAEQAHEAWSVAYKADTAARVAKIKEECAAEKPKSKLITVSLTVSLFAAAAVAVARFFF